MKKLLIIMIIIQCLLVSCYDTAEKRTEKWIDKVSGKAYSYEEGNEKIWIGFSDYNFVIQSLEDENNLWGAIANGLFFIGTAAATQYLESPKKDTALFKFADSYMYFEIKNDTITSYSSDTTNNITKSTNIIIFKYDDEITKKYVTNLMEINDYFATNE
ncbi:hypothetical protein R4K89_13235 [Brachyspira intermedia]|uniref:hypothetical protein n=1 Tax=Brachyspira intermedia TaxID=84377 RepID=UPI0026093FF9|nr:hypothetical protein [uncultured Brachyspira sp.]